jgi:hypothetical protein
MVSLALFGVCIFLKKMSILGLGWPLILIIGLCVATPIMIAGLVQNFTNVQKPVPSELPPVIEEEEKKEV